MRRLNRSFILPLVIVLWGSCSAPHYVFVCDDAFAALEADTLSRGLSQKVQFEIFSTPPTPEILHSLKSLRNASGLVFSPLFFRQAMDAAARSADPPVYAVLPEGIPAPEGVRTVTVAKAGAAQAAVDILSERFRDSESVRLVAILSADDPETSEFFSTIAAGLSPAVTLRTIPLPPAAGGDELIPEVRADAAAGVLVFLGDRTREVLPRLAGALPGLFFLSDRPVPSSSGIQGGYLTCNWTKLYAGLLESGAETPDFWTFQAFPQVQKP